MNFVLDGEETFGDKSFSVWDFPLRHLSEIRRMPYRRGVLRQTQNYDPFVDVALKSYDERLRERIKGYTRAPGDEWDIFERLKKYDKAPRYLRLADTNFRSAYFRAVSECMDEFKLSHPVVPRWILDVDLVKNTSSGYPHFIRKGDDLDLIRQEGRFHFHHLKLYELNRCPLLPCTVATRGGLSESTDPKTRLVWMYPGAMTACEAVFAQPLIDAMYDEKRDLFLTGVDMKFRIQRYLALLDGDDDTYGVGLDFSSFDTFRCTQLIRDAFEVLKQNVMFGYYYDDVTGVQKGRSGVAERAEKAWYNIVEYFIHTPLLLPNGRVVKKHIGVPSGSHFTNLIDSIVNRILIKTFAYYTGRSISNLRTNGDDSAFLVVRPYHEDIVESAASFFADFFGMTVNVAKSCVAGRPSEMHVSGTLWNNLRPYRSTDEWFMLLAYSDTYVATPFDSFQRMLGLGIAGAFRDQEYCKFFDYFQTGYDCRKGPSLLNWKKLRWLEKAFGITDLPIVYKQGSRTTARLRLLVA